MQIEQSPINNNDSINARKKNAIDLAGKKIKNLHKDTKQKMNK